VVFYIRNIGWLHWLAAAMYSLLTLLQHTAVSGRAMRTSRPAQLTLPSPEGKIITADLTVIGRQCSQSQAVRVATQYVTARCTPDAAAQLQPIPYASGAQRALLPLAVRSMNINELMNINDVRESATIFPRPWKLTFDLLTLKAVSSHM